MLPAWRNGNTATSDTHARTDQERLHFKGISLAKTGSLMLSDGTEVVGQDTQSLHYCLGDAELGICAVLVPSGYTRISTPPPSLA